MEIKFHYNKTTIQQFRKQLAIRQKALPILKNKETALRQEEKRSVNVLTDLLETKLQLEERLVQYERFWMEFPNIISLKDSALYYKTIVGVKVPEIKSISFQVVELAWWHYPAWLPAGVDILQQVITLDMEIKVKKLQIDLLKTARKKTTQKVNLYEKVQIPAYESGILKVKRFLEDKENISKAGQKIVKKRKERREAV
ncbi:MAG: V/A-type H+-transporting ATPase subunit D [Marivirga sp.]|jgi:V/A-type H+-transporting ATPase subunit D